ncbi:hypothetical protein NDU88_007205 [Pleurodeles waltl]|uniref:Uncharacterized protein n=1 Tax=Pleurodeles waltl TaxID=8319 RepID=A0AAV7PSV6_PLEWA|nr:hypothetical protein NDU88_007205 [Pleurodeles waltl]
MSQTVEGAEARIEEPPEIPPQDEPELRHILAVMQQSLAQIDGKIDFLSYCVDRMSERLDKQTERVDQVERRISSVEDGQTALASGQLKANTELDILKHKMDDFVSP